MITIELMERLFPTKGLTSPKNLRKYNLVRERVLLVRTLNKILPKYGITTFHRVCAFLGNCGLETDYFKTTVEYASGADYEGRKSLGNTQKGDGKRFKGRGLTQTTGRYNYEQLNKAIGKKVGIDFIANPERLAEIEVAVESACVFWKDHNLNAYADRGEFKQLSGIVNRGNPKLVPLHWSKRKALYELCTEVVPEKISFPPVLTVVPSQPVTPAPTVTEPPALAPVPQPVEPLPSEQSPQTSEPAAPVANLNWDAVQGKYDQIADKCQQPAVQNVARRAGVRLGGGLLTVWSTTGGKIALISTGMVVLGVLGWIIYTYRRQIQIGYEMVKESFFNFFKPRT